MRNFWSWITHSLTVKGAIVTAAGLACDPNVLAVLPAPWARGVAIAGGVCTVLGIRRAMPAGPGGVIPNDAATAATVQAIAAVVGGAAAPNAATDPRGLTPAETAAMDAAAARVNWDKFGKGGTPQP